MPSQKVGDLHAMIAKAKADLDLARRHRDPMRIDLAEGALNSLLERLLSQVSQVTNRGSK
jgi:hypothetical protein